jgi:hypothetical protein
MGVQILDSTITSNGNNLIVSHGSFCNGSEWLRARNNIFLGHSYYYNPGEKSRLYYASGITGNADGPCNRVRLDNAYAVIYGTQNLGADCSATPHVRCIEPKMNDSWAAFYSGPSFDPRLQSGSEAINRATTPPGVSALDFNDFPRQGAWDIGAVEYGSPMRPK